MPAVHIPAHSAGKTLSLRGSFPAFSLPPKKAEPQNQETFKSDQSQLTSPAKGIPATQKMNLKSGPSPEYQKMLADGLLDMTVALGFDEAWGKYPGSHHKEIYDLHRFLDQQGYIRDDAKAQQLFQKSGLEVKAEYAGFFVKELANKDGQSMTAVIRVIYPEQVGKDAQAKQAALEGMNQSDVFMYGGHARYGTGLDFDQDFQIEIDWSGVEGAKQAGQKSYTDFSELKADLGPDALTHFKALEQAGKTKILAQNAGNLVIGRQPLHSEELGAYLMQKSLQDMVSPLPETIQPNKYRLWLFNACRTQDYIVPLREMASQNPAFNTQNLDLITTRQTVDWSRMSDSLMAFVQGLETQESAQALVQGLSRANLSPQQRTHARQGFDDNP